MSITFVQSAFGRVSAGTLATTGAITTTSGNLIVVSVSFFPSTAAVTITDSVGGHVWTDVFGGSYAPNSVIAVQQFYNASITGNAAQTFTATLDTTGYVDIAVTEVSGASATPLDKTAKAGNDIADPRDSGNTATISQANEFLLGMGADDDVQPGTYTVSAPWTQEQNQAHDASYVGLITAHQLVAVATAYSFQFNFSSAGNKCSSTISTWKEAAAVTLTTGRGTAR